MCATLGRDSGLRSAGVYVFASFRAHLSKNPALPPSFVDDEHFCVELVAFGVTWREVALVAMVAFQKRLPERDGMELDHGNHHLSANRGFQHEGVGRHEGR